MSYSFQVTGADKAAAKAAVEAEFDKVVESQPIHSRDRQAALANASAVIDLLVDDPTCDVRVTVNGYVGWRGESGPDAVLTSASINAQAGLALRKAEQPAN
jgi:hypothetical protein